MCELYFSLGDWWYGWEVCNLRNSDRCGDFWCTWSATSVDDHMIVKAAFRTTLPLGSVEVEKISVLAAFWREWRRYFVQVEEQIMIIGENCLVGIGRGRREMLLRKIAAVVWKQNWLENGTSSFALKFKVLVSVEPFFMHGRTAIVRMEVRWYKCFVMSKIPDE